MGSKSRRCLIPTARLQAMILRHKKLATILSLIFISLIYWLSRQGDVSSQQANNKRRGVGGRDAHGELFSTLRRKENGRAAVAIIRVIGLGEGNDIRSNPHSQVQYLVQVKSHDYPIEAFRGAACLLGGNANTHDRTPLDTLKRELNEELHSPDWVNKISSGKVIDESGIDFSQRPHFNSSIIPHIPGTVRYLGTSLHTQTAKLIQRSRPYAFMCALFEITLRPEQLPPSVLYPRGANVREGRLALLTEDQLIEHAKFSWGYEFTMSNYFGRNTTNICEGASVAKVDENIWQHENWTPTSRR